MPKHHKYLLCTQGRKWPTAAIPRCISWENIEQCETHTSNKLTQNLSFLPFPIPSKNCSNIPLLKGNLKPAPVSYKLWLAQPETMPQFGVGGSRSSAFTIHNGTYLFSAKSHQSWKSWLRHPVPWHSFFRSVTNSASFSWKHPPRSQIPPHPWIPASQLVCKESKHPTLKCSCCCYTSCAVHIFPVHSTEINECLALCKVLWDRPCP